MNDKHGPGGGNMFKAEYIWTFPDSSLYESEARGNKPISSNIEYVFLPVFELPPSISQLWPSQARGSRHDQWTGRAICDNDFFVHFAFWLVLSESAHTQPIPKFDLSIFTQRSHAAVRFVGRLRFRRTTTK